MVRMATKDIAFPSTEFPKFPELQVTVPDEWSAMQVPETVLAIGADSSENEFRPNVCVSVTRLPGEIVLDAVAENLVKRFQAIEDFEEIGQETRPVLGIDGFRIEGSFFMEDIGTLFQAVHTAAVFNGKSTDIVEAVATCSANQAEAFVPVLREILDSLKAL